MTHVTGLILATLNVVSVIFFIIGFFYLKNVFAKAYEINQKKSHAGWLYAFMLLFFIRPLADLYFYFIYDTTLNGSMDLLTRFTTILAAVVLAYLCLDFKDLIRLKLANYFSVKTAVFFSFLIYLTVGFLFLPLDVFFTELLFLVLYSLFFYSAWVVASYTATFASVFPLTQTVYGIAFILLLAPLVRLILFLTTSIQSFADFSFLEFVRLISLLMLLAVSFLLVISMYVFKKTVVEKRLATFSETKN